MLVDTRGATANIDNFPINLLIIKRDVPLIGYFVNLDYFVFILFASHFLHEYMP